MRKPRCDRRFTPGLPVGPLEGRLLPSTAAVAEVEGYGDEFENTFQIYGLYERDQQGLPGGYDSYRIAGSLTRPLPSGYVPDPPSERAPTRLDEADMYGLDLSAGQSIAIAVAYVDTHFSGRKYEVYGPNGDLRAGTYGVPWDASLSPRLELVRLIPAPNGGVEVIGQNYILRREWDPEQGLYIMTGTTLTATVTHSGRYVLSVLMPNFSEIGGMTMNYTVAWDVGPPAKGGGPSLGLPAPTDNPDGSPNLAVSALKYDRKRKRAYFEYTLSSALPRSTLIEVFWARGAKKAKLFPEPIAKVAVGDRAGRFRVNVPKKALANPPTAAKKVVVVADRRGLSGDTRGADNQASVHWVPPYTNGGSADW